MRTFFLAALLAAACSAFAAAPLTFEEVDTDGDGLISADEAASVEGLDFDAADSDGDGTLTVDEYEIAVEGLPPPSESEITEDTEGEDVPETSVEPAKPPQGGAAPPAVQPPPQPPSTPPKP
ncbi:MAG: hypothetical protein JNM60_08780 [Candidatus Competibacteraceae bacterium]|nr:hypothetical protein [Candidatus Competibacteraceae bacterium]